MVFFQADDKFWRVKYDHEAAKKARKVKKAAKKAAPRKKGSRPTASELMQLSDSSESEVTPEPVSSLLRLLFISCPPYQHLFINRMTPEPVTRWLKR